MHYLNPSAERAHVVFLFRNHMTAAAACHIGLGVNALHSCKVLRKERIRADEVGVSTADEVHAYLAVTPSITHAVVEAPWIGTARLEKLLAAYPRVHFIVRAHSEVGFLQADPGAVQLLREQVLLGEGTLNFSVAANSERLTQFMHKVYGARVLHLPNLYEMDRVARKRDEPHDRDVVNISSFGALRPC
jgi:hypothetical protein